MGGVSDMRRDLLALALMVVACAVLGWWVQPHDLEPHMAHIEQVPGGSLRGGGYGPDSDKISIGSVQLGMTQQEVQEILGPPKGRLSVHTVYATNEWGNLTVQYSALRQGRRVNAASGLPLQFSERLKLPLRYKLNRPFLSGLFGSRMSHYGILVYDRAGKRYTIRVLPD